MKSDKIIPFPVQPAPAKAELDAGDLMQGVGRALLALPASCANIIKVEFDRDEYVVSASPAAV